MGFILFEGNKITLWRDLTKHESRKINVASLKHPAAVRKCVFSKGCKYLATYAADGVLRVFMVSFIDVKAAGYAVGICRTVMNNTFHFQNFKAIDLINYCENTLNYLRWNQCLAHSRVISASLPKLTINPAKFHIEQTIIIRLCRHIMRLYTLPTNWDK